MRIGRRAMQHGWWLVLVFSPAAVISVVAFGLWPLDAYWVRKDSSDIARCHHNLESLNFSLAQYARDHGGRLPSAETWVDDVMSYLSVRDGQPLATLRCPADRTTGRCSYAMNERLSRSRHVQTGAQSRTILLYETMQAGSNPHGRGRDIVTPGRHRYPRMGASFRANVYCLLGGVIYPEDNEDLKRLRW